MTNSDSPFARPDFLRRPVDYGAFRGQSIGLTGSRGVLGSILETRLRQHEVAVQVYPGNIIDEAALGAWFSANRFSHFFHFAALVPVTKVEANPLLAYQTNVVGTFNICRQLQLTQRESWLFQCSSSHVYQGTEVSVRIDEKAHLQPQTFYGVTKLAAERVVQELLGKLAASYCIGRVFSFSHSRQPEPYLVPTLRRRIAELPEGATLEVRNPSAVRDIQDAETVVDCILHLAAHRATGIVNIGSGHGMSVREIALTVARHLGKTVTVTGTDHNEAGSLIADTLRLQQLLGT